MKIYNVNLRRIVSVSVSRLLIFELKSKSFETWYIDSQFDDRFAIGSGDWHSEEIS